MFLLLGIACGPRPSDVSTRAPDPTPVDAKAFARAFVSELSGPDAPLLAQIDLRAHRVQAYCLDSTDGDQEWCGNFHELDRETPESAAAGRRRVLEIARESLSSRCSATESVPVPRDPRSFGNVTFRGETDATPEEIARYKAFIASIQDERVIRFRCGARHSGLFVVRFVGDTHYWVYGATGSE